jgi:hypothetical protein
MWPFKRRLDVFLLILTGVSITAVLLGQRDPFIRNYICQLICMDWSHSEAAESVGYDLGTGSLISLIFYGLVVRLPEHQKRQRLKRSFARHYKMFKEDVIATILMVTDGTFAWGFQEELIDQKKFRDYFKQNVLPGQDRWDSFHNKLDEYNLEVLLTHMEILRGEILFVLGSIDIQDEDVMEFLKRLSDAIVRMRNTKTDYDSVKSLGHFLWEIFAGFDFATGYRKEDIIGNMIAAI